MPLPDNVVAGELIESAWGNAVVESLTEVVGYGAHYANVGAYTWDTKGEIHTSLSYTGVFPGGRRLFITGHIPQFSAPSTGVVFGVQIQANGTDISEGRLHVGQTVVAGPGCVVECYTEPAAGTITYRLTAYQYTPGGVFCTFPGSAALPMFLLIQDLGPV